MPALRGGKREGRNQVRRSLLPEAGGQGRWRRYLPWLLLVLLIAAAVPMLWLGLYAHPSADDYAYGVAAHAALRDGTSVLGGVWALIRRYYGGWQGTYSAIALMALMPGVWGEDLYALTTVAMLGMLAFSTFKLTHTLICRMAGAPGSWAVGAGSALTLLSAQLVADPLHSFYWWNGSVYYTFTYGVMLLLAERMLRLLLSKDLRQSVWPLASGVVLAVFVGGSNYATALLTAVLLGVLCLYCLVWRREKLPGAAVVTLVMLVSFALSALAPGNARRQAQLTGMPAMEAILSAIGQAWEDFGTWMSPVLALSMALAVPLLYGLAGRTKLRFRLPPLFMAFTFLVYATQNTPHFFAAGTAGPERLRNVVFFSWLWLLFLWEFYLLGWLRRRFAIHEKLSAAAAPVWTAVLAAALAVSCVLAAGAGELTTAEAVRELSDGSAAAYDAQMDARRVLYEDVEVRDVVLSPITARPRLLYWSDAVEDADNWVNTAISNYFLKDSVVLVP